MKLLRVLAFAMAALLVSGFLVSQQQVQGQTNVRTSLEIGLKEGQGTSGVEVSGDVDIFPKVAHVGDTIQVFGRLSIVNERGIKTSEGVVNAEIKLIDVFNNAQNPILLASGITNEKGFFEIVWEVKAKQVFELLGDENPEGTAIPGITAIENVRATVMAIYEGDSTYVKSTSQGYHMELKPLRFMTTVVTDKDLYAVDDVASVTVTFRDRLQNPIELDALSVFFDSISVSPKREDVGFYSFSIPSLTEQIHLLTIIPTKEDYLRESFISTITVSPEIELPVDITASTDQTVYGLGDPVSISGTARPPSVDNPVLLSIINPAGILYNVAQIPIDENGAFDYEFKLAGVLASTGMWTLEFTYLGEQLDRFFHVGEPGMPVMRLGIESPRIIDQLGDAVEDGEVGKAVGIQAEVVNVETGDVKLVYIAKVTDSEGITVMVSWIKIDPLRGSESVKPAIFWIPQEGGEYTIDIFVWTSLANPIPLAIAGKIDLSVV